MGKRRRPAHRGIEASFNAGFEAAFHSGEATPPCTPGIRGRPPRLHAGEARPLCTLGKRRCPARRGIGPPSMPAIRGCAPLRGSEAALHAGEATLPCTPGSEANLNAATLTTLALAGRTQLTTSCNPTTSCRTLFRPLIHKERKADGGKVCFKRLDHESSLFSRMELERLAWSHGGKGKSLWK